jgi:hypothetical protein
VTEDGIAFGEAESLSNSPQPKPKISGKARIFPFAF